MISKETMNYKEELRIYSLLNDTNYTTNHGERKDSLVDIVEEIYFFLWEKFKSTPIRKLNFKSVTF